MCFLCVSYVFCVFHVCFRMFPLCFLCVCVVFVFCVFSCIFCVFSCVFMCVSLDFLCVFMCGFCVFSCAFCVFSYVFSVFSYVFSICVWGFLACFVCVRLGGSEGRTPSNRYCQIYSANKPHRPKGQCQVWAWPRACQSVAAVPCRSPPGTALQKEVSQRVRVQNFGSDAESSQVNAPVALNTLTVISGFGAIRPPSRPKPYRLRPTTLMSPGLPASRHVNLELKPAFARVMSSQRCWRFAGALQDWRYTDACCWKTRRATTRLS